MDHPHEPIDAINDWQIWYRNNNMTQETIYKDPDWKSFWDKPYEGNNVYKQKAAEHFADTIAEFQNELTGSEIYEAFAVAALQALDFVKKEYDNAKELVELIQNNAKN